MERLPGFRIFYREPLLHPGGWKQPLAGLKCRGLAQ